MSIYIRILILFFLLVSNVNSADEPLLTKQFLTEKEIEDLKFDLRFLSDKPVFEYSIGSYNQVTFSLQHKNGKYSLETKTFIEIQSKGDEGDKRKFKTSMKALTKDEFKKYIRFLEAALRYNTLDDAGLVIDGSNWCLDSNMGTTNLSACFWSPSYNTEQRGLTGLYKLAEFLWSESELTRQLNFKDF